MKLNAARSSLVSLIILLAGLQAPTLWAQQSGGGSTDEESAEKPEALWPGDPLWLADMLYWQGDHFRAIGEYKKHLLRHPDDARNDHVRMRMAYLYKEGEQYTAAALQLRKIATANKTDPLGWWSTLYYGNAAREGGRPDLARLAYERVLERCKDKLERKGRNAEAARRRVACLELSSYARLSLARMEARRFAFTKATAQLKLLPRRSPMSSKALQIASYVDGLEIPQKSPWLAGLLSVVPGLGHFYLGEWGTGLVAMVWNGVFIYGIVDSVLDESYGQATLIGLIELIWYGGTIFGAVAGAQRFNRDAKRIVYEGMLRDINGIDDRRPWPSRFPLQSPQLKLKLRF